jgi:hypothetical protein
MGKAKFRPIHLILIYPIKSYDSIKLKDFESEDVELKMLYFYEKFSINIVNGFTTYSGQFLISGSQDFMKIT